MSTKSISEYGQFIHYEAHFDELRAVVAYVRIGEYYYGYYEGYCGGGVIGDYFFKLSADFKHFQKDWAECWEEVKDPQETDLDCMYEAWDKLKDAIISPDGSWDTLNPKWKKKMLVEKDDEGHKEYYFKSKNLNWNVIVALSQYWSLLTTYSPLAKGQPINCET
jgi:hypothetical protein